MLTVIFADPPSRAVARDPLEIPWLPNLHPRSSLQLAPRVHLSWIKDHRCMRKRANRPEPCDLLQSGTMPIYGTEMFMD